MYNSDEAEYGKITAVDICFGRKVNHHDNEELEVYGGDDRGVQQYSKKRWNLNMPFRSDRSEDRLRPETFDLINSRFLVDGIDASRWQSYIRDLRQVLKKGAWAQMVEIIPHVQSNNGRLSDDSNLTTWWLSYSRILSQMGKNVRIPRELERLLADEGFLPVRCQTYDLPVGTWHRSSSFRMVTWIPLTRSQTRR